METNTISPRILSRLLALLRTFFAAVPGSLKDHLNPQELSRISVTAFSAGGGVFGVLQAVAADTATIFPAPADAALAAAVLTTVIEVRRRLAQGQEPTPAPRRSRLSS